MIKKLLNKWFKLLLNERGEVDNEGEPKGIENAIEDLINQDSEAGDNSNDNKSDDQNVDDEKSSDDKSKETKKDEKPADEDPDVELDYEEEEGKGKAKSKLSELKNLAKWMKENKSIIGGAFQVRELALKNKDFGKLMETIISKSFTGDKYNSDFVDATLKSFEKKAEKIEEKIDDKDADIEEAENALEELDPETSQARALAKSIKIMKQQKNELKGALSKLDEFSKKLEGIEQKQTQSEKTATQEKHTGEVKRISEVFKKELGTLTDPKNDKGYKFIDEEDQQTFDKSVRKLVSARAQEIKTDEDFKNVIKESAKVAYENINKRNQSVINNYLKTKGMLPKEKEKENVKQKDETQNMSLDSLSSTVEEMLTKKE